MKFQKVKDDDDDGVHNNNDDDDDEDDKDKDEDNEGNKNPINTLPKHPSIIVKTQIQKYSFVFFLLFVCISCYLTTEMYI